MLQADMGLVRGVSYWFNVPLNVPQSTLELRAKITCERVLILPQKYFIICIKIQTIVHVRMNLPHFIAY